MKTGAQRADRRRHADMETDAAVGQNARPIATVAGALNRSTQGNENSPSILNPVSGFGL
jgi:hypothetical protein